MQQSQNKNILKMLKITLKRVDFQPTFYFPQAADLSVQQFPVPSFDMP